LEGDVNGPGQEQRHGYVLLRVPDGELVYTKERTVYDIYNHQLVIIGCTQTQLTCTCNFRDVLTSKYGVPRTNQRIVKVKELYELLVEQVTRQGVARTRSSPRLE